MKQRLLDIAELIDSFRVVPRIILLCYGYMVYDITMWFKILENPSSSQSMFISVVYGAAAGIFGLYSKSGREWRIINPQNRSDGPRQ